MNNLIQLPINLGLAVSKILEKKGIKPRKNSFGTLSLQFTKEELGLITDIAIDNESLKYMGYFPNIKSASFNSNVDVSSYVIQHFINTHPNLESLEISNQQDLRILDLSNLAKLKTLKLFSNHLLEKVNGLLNKEDLFQIDCYNNSNFENNEEICKKMVEVAYATGQCTADAMYFSKVMDIVNQNKDYSRNYSIIASNFNWREKLTTHFHVDHYTGEMKLFYDKARKIVQSYVKPTDTPEQKYAIIYQWLCENVEYDMGAANSLTHTRSEDGIVMGRKFGSNGMTNGLLYGNCVCQGYVHTAKFLLDLCDIKSTDVLCAASRTNRERLSTTSDIMIREVDTDHSILKINLGDGNAYYSDITFDSTRYRRGDDRECFLLSYDDISKDHRLFNEQSTFSNSKSFTKEQQDELLRFASERIRTINLLYSNSQNQLNTNQIIDDLRMQYSSVGNEIEKLMQHGKNYGDFELRLQELVSKRDGIQEQLTYYTTYQDSMDNNKRRLGQNENKDEELLEEQTEFSDETQLLLEDVDQILSEGRRMNSQTERQSEQNSDFLAEELDYDIEKTSNVYHEDRETKSETDKYIYDAFGERYTLEEWQELIDMFGELETLDNTKKTDVIENVENFSGKIR